MPRLHAHGFTISLVVLLVTCSTAHEELDGAWSGRIVCECQGQTSIEDGLEGELQFEFARDGSFQTWMDPKDEGAWGMKGVYRVEGDSLIWKHNASTTWIAARILMMAPDSMVIEESPEKGCICTSHLRRKHQQ